jgi:hypothetical protein
MTSKIKAYHTFYPPQACIGGPPDDDAGARPRRRDDVDVTTRGWLAITHRVLPAQYKVLFGYKP